MTRIETSIEIRATPATVWRILADLSGHSQWNPFIRSIEGRLERGERLGVRIAPPGRKVMAFRPRVLVVDEPHELRWIGRLSCPASSTASIDSASSPSATASAFIRARDSAGC
jgi:uncharacterized protein YndB with AHSA1/START domain